MLFPHLAGKIGRINLAAVAEKWLLDNAYSGDGNPFLIPAFCQQVLDEHHAAQGWVGSYGGYLEGRGKLWEESYLPDGEGDHLGIDYNVPSGTLVAACESLRILKIDNDHPEPYGWGQRIVARVLGTPYALIYAHLDEIVRSEGEVVHPGDILAAVGRPENNGGWHSHLHAQAVWNANDAELIRSLPQIDGYGATRYRARNRLLYPDPSRFVR